jgi:hypothetical protein
LAEGKNRHEAATLLGYQSYMGLHNYMVRHNYIWNNEIGNYFNSDDNTTITKVIRMKESIPGSKISSIISEFQNGLSSREIAKRFNFESTRDMASYMRIKGYFWDINIKNYKKQTDETIDIIMEVNDEEIKNDKEKNPDAKFNYNELLEFLDSNIEKLQVMLREDFNKGNIPRYVLCGINVTKSVHMVSTLDQLTRAYSQEKNITQREIFQVALIEFFKKYGYSREIDALLNRY